jgi:hypothetical protein
MVGRHTEARREWNEVVSTKNRSRSSHKNRYATKNAYLAAVRHIQYLLQSESKVASTQCKQGNNEWGLEAVLLCTNKMTLLYTSKFYG